MKKILLLLVLVIGGLFTQMQAQNADPVEVSCTVGNVVSIQLNGGDVTPYPPDQDSSFMFTVYAETKTSDNWVGVIMIGDMEPGIGAIINVEQPLKDYFIFTFDDGTLLKISDDLMIVEFEGVIMNVARI